MKSKLNAVIAVFVVLVLCAFTMIGCQGQQRVTPQGQQPGVQQPGGQQLGAPGVQAPGTRVQDRGDLLDNTPDMNKTGTQMGAQNNEQRAANITNQLSKMNEIDKVNTVCSGDTAVIAYSPSKTAGNTDAVKNMIVNKVKQANPGIKNVAVSESADIMQKVRQLGKDMANRPMNQIDDEVRRLVQQIKPTMR